MSRKAWIGHAIRNSPWITAVIEGKVEGKPGRGRTPRTPFLKQVKKIWYTYVPKFVPRVK